MKAAKKQAKPLAPSWDLVAVSWQLLIKYFEPILFLFVLPSLLLVLGSLLLGNTANWHHLADSTGRQRTGLALIGLSILWSILNFGPSLYFRLQATANKPVSLIGCYRKGLRFFWRLVGLNLAIGLVIVAGLLLFIIPGLVLIYLFIKRYYLVEYYLVDRDLSIRQSLATSQHETEAYSAGIWGLIGVQICFSLLAAIVSSFSRIGAVPAIFIQLVVLFLPALRYREIKAAQRTGGKSSAAHPHKV